jgi:hypothetical protein
MDRYDTRQPILAFVLEVVFGTLFASLGIGWFYAGKVGTGLILLIGYWLLAGVIAATLIVGTFGIFCLLLPAQNLIISAISGYFAYRSIKRRQGFLY